MKCLRIWEGRDLPLRGAQRLLPESWETKQGRTSSDVDRFVDWPVDKWQDTDLFSSVFPVKVMGKDVGETEGEDSGPLRSKKMVYTSYGQWGSNLLEKHSRQC